METVIYSTCWLIFLSSSHFVSRWFLFHVSPFSGTYVLFPLFCGISFGRKYLGATYGILFLSQILGSTLSSFLTQRLSPIVGYAGLCYLFSLCVMVTFFFALFPTRRNFDVPCPQLSFPPNRIDHVPSLTEESPLLNLVDI